MLSGRVPDGNLQSFEFMGGRTEVTRPFAQPRILGKYLAGLRSPRIRGGRLWRATIPRTAPSPRHSDDARIDGSWPVRPARGIG
jgi:hypothetical protein